MIHKNKLLFIDSISAFSIGMSDLALISMAYAITESADETGVLIAVRLTSSLLVFLLMKPLTVHLPLRTVSLAADTLRVFVMPIAILATSIEQLYMVAFALSFLFGVNVSVRSSAYKQFVPSDDRVAFLSKQQSIYAMSTVMSPLAAGALIRLFDPVAVFYMEAVLFIFCVGMMVQMPDWQGSRETRTPVKLTHILIDKIQWNVLAFRLMIVTVLTGYQIAMIHVLSEDSWSYMLGHEIQFSDRMSYFSLIAALAVLAGARLTSKTVRIETLKTAFLTGATLVGTGCLIWAFNASLWLLLTLGTVLIFTGLAPLRIALQAAGIELTEEHKLPYVISASDMLTRTHQSLVGLAFAPVLFMAGAPSVFVLLAGFCVVSAIPGVYLARLALGLKKISG